MRKLLPLLVALILVFSLSCAVAEDYVYGTATLTYAEFYSGDVSSVDAIDAVTSATVGKSGTFSNTVTDFVDEATNPDGYHVLGIANVNVAVPAADVEAYKAINDTFVESDEVPAQYKTVSIADGAAAYGTTQFNIAETVSDAEITIDTDSHWGDYILEVRETTTQHIRNTREDTGFDVGSGIQGIIVETASGLKVGMEHLQSIWVQPWEISWNVTIDNSHNTELAYDNLAELDKLMGETITRVTFINANDAYVYETDGVYVPVKFGGSMSVEGAASASGTTAYTVEDLPDDYQPVYSVDGLESACEDGALTWTEALPGAYTLLLTDGGNKYAKLTADFILSTDVLPVAFDADNNALVAADGADAALAARFIENLSTVSVNGTDYKASGRGAVAIINTEGEIDFEAAVVNGRGKDATSTPVFGESGEYEITAAATGFDQTITFTVTR